MKSVAQRGIAIVSAIFILLVLAILGAFVVRISTAQHTTSTLDMQSARVYQAARAGIEWGLYQVNVLGRGVPPFTALNTTGTACPGGTSSSTSSFSPTPVSMTGMAVTVTCNSYTDGGGAPVVYRIVATACNQPVSSACPNTTTLNELYVERRLEVLLSPSRP
jgi:MSHA biogenesis protein MshP